jgi:hypothetical protein
MKIRTLAATALATALAGCSAEFSGVAIYEICSPPDPEATSGSCLYPATCSAQFGGTPKLDVLTAALPFRLPVQINNTLPDNSDPANGRINTNNAVIETLELTYTGVALDPVTVPTSIRVGTNGSSGALLELIPVAYFPSLVPAGAATTSLVVNVRGRGVLDSQSSFTTAWFQVPVQICAGCLAGSCPPGTVVASCPGTAPGATSPGQSASVTCITVTP